jgi:cation diffusion facilitator CzcD-associated flavoprotein CzcO
MEGTGTSEMPGTGEAQKGLRAIVIGSGMAGLQAAAALSRLFQNVIVLERDNVAEARYLMFLPSS